MVGKKDALDWQVASAFSVLCYQFINTSEEPADLLFGVQKDNAPSTFKIAIPWQHRCIRTG